ncbi:MAG: TrmH family RNA methyltransferase [Turicibacter sp.]
MLIESNQNQKVKKWVKLKQKKYRYQFEEFIVEGEHLVQEAISSNRIKEILIQEGASSSFISQLDEKYPTYVVKENIFKQIASTETPQPIMAVCTLQNQELKKLNRLLLVDRVQDPGNLGTLIRSAVAFKFDGILLNEGCVDLYNEKVIRSTQGAIFKLPIVIRNLENEIPLLKREKVKVYGTALKNGQPLNEMAVQGKMAFILGNEGSGVSEALLDLTDKNIFVEMSENVESLNVSIAGSIIMHHFRL